MNTIQLKVTNNRLHDYGLPERLSPQGAGYSLRAAIDGPIILYPEETEVIPTGIALGLFDDLLAAFICPVPQTAHTSEVVLQNGALPLSTDTQGEVVVRLKNEGQDLCRINPGEVVAQLVFSPITHPLMEVVSELKAPVIELEPLAPAALTGLGLSHSPGTHDDLLRVFPTELVGNDRGAECPVYTRPDVSIQDRGSNPPDGLDEVLAAHE